MSSNFEKTWEIYVASWKVETAEEKISLFKQCMSPISQYNDPMIKTEGYDELVKYMLEFHQQIPGGHFVTTYFLAHSDKSIARWQMRNGDNEILGDGISYAEYDEDGMLTSETGFFELPSA